METLPTEMLCEIMAYADVVFADWNHDFHVVNSFEEKGLGLGRLFPIPQNADVYATVNLKRTNKALYKAFQLEYDKWRRSR